MAVQKIHIILFSSILILFCVRIAHTAPAKQQNSSDFEIVDFCLETITTINVASNDTGFILTSNCIKKDAQLFKLVYGDADANDAEVTFGWSSTSGVSISTGSKGQIPVKNITATESYWNPNGENVYYFPSGHSVNLTVYKGCSEFNVRDESVKKEQLVSDARKQKFSCERSKQLVNNMNKFSNTHVFSCDLNTRTWEDYDVSCNGPLRCVDLSIDQKPSGCEIWRIHENAGIIVNCSNADSADEPSFNLMCENRQQVLGNLGSSFRLEVDTLEVTCKGASDQSKSWFTSTNQAIPQPLFWGCSNPKKDIEKYERMIEKYNQTIKTNNLAIMKYEVTIDDHETTIADNKKNAVIYIVLIIIIGICCGTQTPVTVYCAVRKRMLLKKQAKNKSGEWTQMEPVDHPSTAQQHSGNPYHVLERDSRARLTRYTAYEEISVLPKSERKRTDVAGEYAYNDKHAPKPTEGGELEGGGVYEVINLDNNGQLQEVAVSAQTEMPTETYASVNKIGKKSRIETQADAECKQIEQTQPSNENDYQPALPERNLTQSSPNETG